MTHVCPWLLYRLNESMNTLSYGKGSEQSLTQRRVKKML